MIETIIVKRNGRLWAAYMNKDNRISYIADAKNKDQLLHRLTRLVVFIQERKNEL